MLAKAVGLVDGVSRGAHAVVVRVPRAKPKNGLDIIPPGGTRLTGYIAALEAVLEDVNAKGKTKQSVVCLPMGIEAWDPPMTPGHRDYILYDVIKRLIESFVIVVASVGNILDSEFERDFVGFSISINWHHCQLALARKNTLFMLQLYGEDPIYHS